MNHDKRAYSAGDGLVGIDRQNPLGPSTQVQSVIEFIEKASELLAANVPFVAVTVVDATGSVPQEIGAKMLVIGDGLHYGTVGGGKIEARAIEVSQEMLARSSAEPSPATGETRPTRTHFVQWSLEQDIGMTCGGSVKLYFESHNVSCWHITVFGAGHCASALIEVLLNLECKVTCIDSREQWLKNLPESPKLTKIHATDLLDKVAGIPAGSYLVLMTMGHTTDKPILLEILKHWEERRFPYLGVIGSRAKAARLKRDVIEAGLPPEYTSLFFCPIGLKIGRNVPQEIAISITAQLLQERDHVLAAPSVRQDSETGSEPSSSARAEHLPL